MWWPFASKYPEHYAVDVDALEFDYIIVGGGTAGCVLASRLSEDPDTSVLVLERGVANDTRLSRVPMISFNLFDPQYGANRKIPLFTAKVLGGNSRINGTVYTRGSAADYDAWAVMGRTDWSYEKVLPYFVKAQTSISRPKSAFCGDSGPWITQAFSYSDLLFKVHQAVRKSATAWGLPPIDDVNAPDAPCDGFGAFWI
ncbi:hypothetical protein B0J14DRAFT_680693 [Halenospora varia]|nr:hypothetical protein B0J14DRAFT_680693 [Halenospora varia]